MNDGVGGRTPGSGLDRLASDRLTSDRRTFIRRAGIAGAVAWTAPVLLESMMSPAAAASVGAFSTGEVLTSTSIAAATQLPATAAFTSAVSSSQIVVVLVAAAWPNDSSTARALTLTGPFASATLIATSAATNAPWIIQGSGTTGTNTKFSQHLYAYYGVGNGTTTAVRATFAGAPGRAALIAFPVSGTTTAAPIGVKSTASDTASPYLTPTFNISGATAGRSMVAFGGLTDTAGSVAWTPPSGFTKLADLGANSASLPNGNLDISASFGPSQASTSAGVGVGVPWSSIAFEIK